MWRFAKEVVEYRRLACRHNLKCFTLKTIDYYCTTIKLKTAVVIVGILTVANIANGII